MKSLSGNALPLRSAVGQQISSEVLHLQGLQQDATTCCWQDAEAAAALCAQGDRLEDDWQPEQDERGAEERADESRKLEAHSRAVVLEMIGDLPEADAKPPSDMLFVCKLNPVTTEEVGCAWASFPCHACPCVQACRSCARRVCIAVQARATHQVVVLSCPGTWHHHYWAAAMQDLEIIFSRFGKITSCDILRDYKTGDSLCYAFIGFDSDKGAEDAFFKMNNVLIDDRRIKVSMLPSM